MAITTNSVNSTAASSSSSSAKKNDNSPEAIQERFMTLLVAQLKNQDPMAPMDNAQVTSQMAQLNTVTGINKLNDSMSSMASSFTATQTAQAVTMLGRTILTEGDDLALANGQATGSVEFKQSADTVKISILNSKGETVRTLDMGPQSKGTAEFTWDGKGDSGSTLPAGNYTFKVDAIAAGQAAEVVPLSKAVVQGVRNAGAEGTKLLTNLGTEVAFSNIKQVF